MSRFPLCSLVLILALSAGGLSCHREENSSKEKVGKSERHARALKERETIAGFVRQLDELVAWRASADSPVEPAAAAAATASRLQSLSSEALPDDLRAALADSQLAWSSLAAALAKQTPGTPEVEEKTRQADAADGKLNQLLAAKGFNDVAL